MACLAFMSSSRDMLTPEMDWPAASVFTMPEIGSCPPATWWAVTPTGHFSAVVTFFQSASDSFWMVAVNSAALASYFFASDSARAPMGEPPGKGVRPDPTDRSIPDGARAHIIGGHREEVSTWPRDGA